MATRSVFFNHSTFVSFFARSITTARPQPYSPAALSFPSIFLRRAFLRPLSAVISPVRVPSVGAAQRCFATRTTSSSLRDPNPNWSNRPPKETILLDGCDFEHWLVVMEKPEGDLTRDEIIDSYIKTLAQVVGSEEEARMKIYSVSHRCYFAFGALVSEEVSLKIKELPRVRWVLPDSYLDVKNKDYGGEPFINGQAVPYDPKYHEEWIRNHNRAMDRNKRNDRPRNFDRSRNFERRRENRDFQNQVMPNSMLNAPPHGNQGGMSPNSMGPTTQGGMPPNLQSGMPPNPQGGIPPNPQGGMPSNPQGGIPPNPQGGMPPNPQGGMPPNLQGEIPPNLHGGMPPNPQGGMPGMPPNPQGRMPSSYHSGMPPSYRGGMQQNYNGGLQQNYQGGVPPSSSNGITPANQSGIPPNNMNSGMGGPPRFGGMQPPNNVGNALPPPAQQNYIGAGPQDNFGGLAPQGSMVGQQNGVGYQSNPGWANTMPPQRDSVSYIATRDPSTVPGGYNNY